jgi:ribosomal protein L37AE/L43A
MSAFIPTPTSAHQKPAVCPFCRSGAVSTTSTVIGENTYWRCGGCGQIWNQSRLLAWKVSP